MKRAKILFLTLFFILIQVTSYAFAEEVDKPLEMTVSVEENMEENQDIEPNLKEKYELLKEENLNLRKEILRLHNKFSKAHAEKIPVFMYHHILPEEYIKEYNWSNNCNVLSVETFREQMDFLYNNGFYTATLDELQDFLDGEIDLPKKTVVLTFDDGYLSNAIYAYPIMQKYNFIGTIFMQGYRANDVQAPFDPSTTQSISIYEAYKYRDVFDYGSHTYDLHGLDENKEKLLLSSEREIVIEDLLKSKELMNTKYFTYPYGAYDGQTIEYLIETGYEMAFTIEEGYVTKDSNKYTLPRFAVEPGKMPIGDFVQISFGNY